ncbi:suppressor of fused protein SUFU [Nitrospirillum amazonense]|uniref:Suppressor of fused protein SUFU n=1 Tax=Nitrospirillum amazonense TaxID=28077 RepID=A0A560FMI9_9PROT|nr:suppressor of fused protein SUFU [Nitrospirillum amazonense]
MRQLSNTAKTTASAFGVEKPPVLRVWGDGFRSRKIADRTTAWLLAVPVSKKEIEYAAANGPAKLEKLFAERDTDIYNLNRLSVD